MFNEGEYDKPEFSIPANGMNQYVSPDALPANFCYLLENIIPAPLGVGQVRYGTGLVYEFVNPEYSIFRAFEFTLNGSTYQALLYIAYYVQDLGLANIVIVDQSHFHFDSATQDYYLKDTKIKIVYTIAAVNYVLYSEIKDVSVVGATVNITLGNNILPDSLGITINEIWAQRGLIYDYNLTTNTLGTLRKSNLEIACVPRCVYFMQRMLICNGVNNVMEWDGTTLNDVSEYVVEMDIGTIIRINNNNFSFVTKLGFNTFKYFIGNSISLVVNGAETILTIQNKNTVLNVVTITTIEVIPAFTGADRIAVSYLDKPPAFSYMYASKDRLWALGPGRVGLEYRDTNEQLKVYYNYRVNSRVDYGFFDENKKIVPYIDMSNKTNVQDNFEAITQINGLMAFIGRRHTQVWTGYTPGQGGDFSWSSTIPEGIFHGDLLLSMPNDTYFVSENGVKSFGTLNVAKQFSANADEAVDPIVKKFILDAKSSNSKYRACTAFQYDGAGFAGFKISNNKVIASLFETRLYSWFYLSGDFSIANFFSKIGKLFYLFIGNKIFKYADGNDGSQKLYADQGGNSFISISWIPGLINFKNKKGFANKWYQFIMNYPSSFILNDKNSIKISIFGDTPRNFELTDKCNFQYRGDLFETEPLAQNVSNTAPGFRLNQDYEVLTKKLKFESSIFWLSISGYVMNGPITIRKVRLFGVGER